MEAQIASRRSVAAAAVAIMLASACSTPSAPSSVPNVANDSTLRDVVSDSTSFTDSSAGTPAPVVSPLSTFTSTLSTPQDGWASITGFRNAETLVQRRIVQSEARPSHSPREPKVLQAHDPVEFLVTDANAVKGRLALLGIKINIFRVPRPAWISYGDRRQLLPLLSAKIEKPQSFRTSFERRNVAPVG